MNVEFNNENRRANNSVRRCSFCRRQGHNITRCNSEIINMFERQILDVIQLIVSQGQENITNIASLRRYLLNKALEQPNLVRAFAVSRCGANSRTNMDSYIAVIIQHFMINSIQNTETNNQNNLNNQEAVIDDIGLFNQPWRQFEFSEFGIHQLLENEPILYNTMFANIIRFIEIIRTISERSQLNRKFDIKTIISENENQDDLEEKCECNICYEEREKKVFVKLDCGHEFCKDCIRQSLQNEQRQKPCCAFCRSHINNIELKLESIKNEFNDLIITEIQL
jgi:hypothetical protein